MKNNLVENIFQQKIFYIETNGTLVLKLKANMLLTKGGNSYLRIGFK